MGIKSQDSDITELASRFLKLEGLCRHPREGTEVEKCLREMGHCIGRLAEDSPSSLRELFSDLKVRVTTWQDVWGRLGKQADFRNAVGREAYSWSKKLSKLLLPFLFIFLATGCATVPRTMPATSFPPQPQGMTHVVGTGDTLWKIAREYGVAMQDIMRTNQLADANRIAVGQQIIIPEAEVSVYREPSYPPVSLDLSVEKRVGPRHPRSDWRYITMHHSATRQGSAKSFDRTHRRRRMGGLFYHFVVGNGTGSRNGEVEVGWRWKKQADVNRPHDIQICLVGDFSSQRVTEAQFETLVNLVRILQRQYDIPTNHVRRHKDIRGKSTECPGSRFPFQRLLAELRRTGS